MIDVFRERADGHVLALDRLHNLQEVYGFTAATGLIIGHAMPQEASAHSM
jgi:hypothetical protein